MNKNKLLLEAENRIDLLEYIVDNNPNLYVKRLNERTYRINPCPICDRKDHFTVYQNENRFWTYAECGVEYQGGKITEYLIEAEGLSEEETIKKVFQLAGMNNYDEYEEM